MKRCDNLRAMLIASSWLAIFAFTAQGADNALSANDPKVRDYIAVIARVGPQGAGSSDARIARDALAQCGVEVLPALLVAMDTRNAVAANWYRTALEEIVARESASEGAVWPMAYLKEYAGDSRHAGRPRRLAVALVERREPGFTAAWVPTRLGDPEFGYEAVAHALTAGEQALRDKNTELAKVEFRKAFEYTHDSNQVSQAAAKLKTLGETVDPIKHLGLVVNWWLVGPFDAPEKTGFARSFEPEQRVDLKATYTGKEGKLIGWFAHQASDRLGQLDLIAALGTTREAVAYAYCEIDVTKPQAAQMRCGADDNCTVWFNGQKVFGRDQWLNGTRFDRFITPITLTAGRNTLLVKICQGPQHKDPEVPNPWSLQLRLCDEQGQGLKFRPLSPMPVEQVK